MIINKHFFIDILIICLIDSQNKNFLLRHFYIFISGTLILLLPSIVFGCSDKNVYHVCVYVNVSVVFAIFKIVFNISFYIIIKDNDEGTSWETCVGE